MANNFQQSAQAFRKPGPTYAPGGTTVGGCPTPSGPYISPGTQGACAPRGSGFGWFGMHEGTYATTEVGTTVSPQRPVTIKQIIADVGAGLINTTTITTLKVNTDLLLHGSDAPLSIFAPDAATPVPFDMTLSTADTISVTTIGSFTPAAAVTSLGGFTNATVELAGVNCYDSRYGLDYACAPMGKNNRSIILGMGRDTIAAGNSGTGTASISPSTPIRLGRLVIDAFFSDTLGATVQATTGGGILGVAAGGGAIGDKTFAGPGHTALPWLKVTEISVNNVNLLTNIPSTGGIPATAFSAQSKGMFFPDIVCSQADTIRVKFSNLSQTQATAVSPAGTDNGVTICAAWVGCEVLGSC